MFTREISIPAFLHFVYGETTCLRDLLLIHGSALLAAVYVVFGSLAIGNWSVWQQLAALILASDLVGGIVAHLLPKNRDYWRVMRAEWLVLWAMTYAWQPLLFGKAFMGGLLLLSGLHLGSILLIVGQYWFGNRHLFAWLVVALLGGFVANALLMIPQELAWFAPLYFSKAALFDKISAPRPKPKIQMEAVLEELD